MTDTNMRKVRFDDLPVGAVFIEHDAMGAAVVRRKSTATTSQRAVNAAGLQGAALDLIVRSSWDHSPGIYAAPAALCEYAEFVGGAQYVKSHTLTPLMGDKSAATKAADDASAARAQVCVNVADYLVRRASAAATSELAGRAGVVELLTKSRTQPGYDALKGLGEVYYAIARQMPAAELQALTAPGAAGAAAAVVRSMPADLLASWRGIAPGRKSKAAGAPDLVAIAREKGLLR